MRKQVSVGGFLNLAVAFVNLVPQDSTNCGGAQPFLPPQGGKPTRLQLLRNLLKGHAIGVFLENKLYRPGILIRSKNSVNLVIAKDMVASHMPYPLLRSFCKGPFQVLAGRP